MASSLPLRLAGAVGLAAASLVLAGCGGADQDARTTETAREARPPQGNAAAGKAIFADQGCGGCHTFAAAGSTGTIGPDLDETLKRDAERAGKPLADFVRESIVRPDAFVAPGFKRGVMPKTFDQALDDQELADLVAFLTRG